MCLDPKLWKCSCDVLRDLSHERTVTVFSWLLGYEGAAMNTLHNTLVWIYTVHFHSSGCEATGINGFGCFPTQERSRPPSLT